ncbi:MAG: right-handed parallel beta-helix repeat-containing protein, partial [Bacteroidales bacterium]|nr:right-handed parallel beta-helix repeat-containing protein [Bacteroidales bacterium]
YITINDTLQISDNNFQFDYTLTKLACLGGGLWRKSNSPYLIDCDINVPVDSILMIEPGVEIIFEEGLSMNVYGRLIAVGKETDSIIFTVADTTGFSTTGVTEGGWLGLRFLNTALNGQDSSKLEYCIIEYGKGVGSGSDENGGGIYLENCAPVLIRKSLIHHNYATLNGGGIYSLNSDINLSNVLLSGNKSNIGGAGYFGGHNPSLVNVTVSDNIALSNGGGIYINDSTINLMNSILWNNYPEEIFINAGNALVEYSDIMGGWPGTGNIDADPLFANPSNGDFRLTWLNYPIPDSTKSLCIDSGIPDPQYNDPDGTRNDMGAFYFYQY